MNIQEIELPTNRKFGLFFTLVFVLVTVYFYAQSKTNLSYIFGGLGGVIFIITALNAELLLPLNKLWMKLGVLIGSVVSPVVLAIIYFGLFTPVGILTRLGGRDELRLKMNKDSSYWIQRNAAEKSGSFKNQF